MTRRWLSALLIVLVAAGAIACARPAAQTAAATELQEVTLDVPTLL